MQQRPVIINARPQDAYRQQNVLTSTPVDLVVMLYDALKTNIVRARKGIAKKDVEAAHKYLMKAQDIVTELVSSLDMNYEIAERLLTLYEFINGKLQDANYHKDPELLEPVIEILDDLRGAWREVSKSNKGSLYKGEELA